MDAEELLENLPKNHLEDLYIWYTGEEKQWVLMSMRKETFELIKYAIKRYGELAREKLEAEE